MKKIISSFIILLILNFSVFAAKKGGEKYLTVKPTAQGLLITKKHPAMFKYITIHVVGENSENISISATDTENKFLYPFVEAGKNYSLYLVMMDKNWGNWTQTESVKVLAEGGMGDYKYNVNSFHYDNDLFSVVFDNYEWTKPELDAARIVGENYSGNVFYSFPKNQVNYSNPTWGVYECKNGVLDISSKAKFYNNRDFFIQIDYQFTYEGIRYAKTLISNEQNVFTDVHPVVNISTSSGVLHPMFNFKCKEYDIRATEEPVEITIEKIKDGKVVEEKYKIDEENNFLPVTIKTDDDEVTYTFTYEPPVLIDFENRQFYQTFYDDFEGTELNPKNFHHSAEEERQPNQKNHGFWRNECAYLDGNGNLVIEAKKTPDALISGAVETSGLFEQSHGFYEMRFKCDKTSGLWYAFWLMGQNDEAHIGKGATDAAEIDIWELVPNEKYGQGPNYFKTTVNWDAYGSAHKAKDSGPNRESDSFYDEWHISTFLWDEKSYSLYLDGKLKWIMDASVQNEAHFGGMCNGSNWIIISSEFGEWGGDIDEKQLPARMMVDWVRAGVER